MRSRHVVPVVLFFLVVVVPGATAQTVPNEPDAADSVDVEHARPDSLETDSISGPVYILDEVVVLATRNPVNRTVTVHELDREEIDALDIRNARDALEHVTGVYFSRSARNEYTFRLRGFEQRQVAVFLDGVPISSPYDGVVDVSQLTGGDLDRVRVSHGSSSLLYGPNSLGGVVDVMTRPPSNEFRLDLRLEGSDQGRTYGAAEFSAGTDRLRVSGSGALERSGSFQLADGFEPTPNEDGDARDNSSYVRARLGLKTHFLLSDRHSLALHLSRTGNRYDVPPNAVTQRPRYWRFPEWSKTLVSLNTRHELGSKVSLRTAWYQDSHANLLQSFDDDTYTTQTARYAFDSEYDDHSRGVNIFPTLRLLPVGVTDAVLMYRRDVHRERTGDAPFDGYSTDLLSLGIEQDVAWSDRIGMVFGVNLNHLRPLTAEAAELRDPLLQVNGQAAVELRSDRGASVHLGLARKSRFPTLKELYSSRLGRNIPNPGLLSEVSLHAEAGVDLQRGPWSAGIAVFRSNLEDLIANAMVGDGLQQLQNVSTAVLQGLELEARVRTGSASLAASYTLTHARNTSPDRASDHLEYRPRHRIDAHGRMTLTGGLGIGAELQHTARQFYQDQDTGAWERLNDMLGLGGSLDYDVGSGARVYARVENLLDAAHFSEYGVPLPGRELSVGVEMELR